MPTTPLFTKLNNDWNAEPNAPSPEVWLDGTDLLLRFYLNPHVFPQFQLSDKGVFRFSGCSRYRLGYPNMDGWFFGECRYSKLAPEWGEFYELIGDDPSANLPTDWQTTGLNRPSASHFLFYLRDERSSASPTHGNSSPIRKMRSTGMF